MYELSLASVSRDTVTFVATGVEWLTVVMPREKWESMGHPPIIEVTLEP